MTDSPPNAPKLEVWMDGECPVCRRSQAWCEVRDPQQRFVFRDFRQTADPDLAVERRTHEETMWVRTETGSLYQGFAAWRLIMSELPGWRWIAWVAGLPPFKWIGPPAYRLVARLRYRLR